MTRHIVALSGPSWPRCDSPSCWCATCPRVVPSTGQAYTVEELHRSGRTRIFRYKHSEVAW